jgi:multisubunit Na+/H+ antiporter MnhE subunit
MQLAGGSYIKNILSFFVIIVMMLLLISGEWRKHVFIIAYTVGYHMVLVMSSFAQSGRFHMPVMPIILLFAAYGIQMAKGNQKMQRGFTIALVLEVIICLAWNWFKLKGRGMV